MCNRAQIAQHAGDDGVADAQTQAGAAATRVTHRELHAVFPFAPSEDFYYAVRAVLVREFSAKAVQACACYT